jgi:hypothetical protein
MIRNNRGRRRPEAPPQVLAAVPATGEAPLVRRKPRMVCRVRARQAQEASSVISSWSESYHVEPVGCWVRGAVRYVPAGHTSAAPSQDTGISMCCSTYRRRGACMHTGHGTRLRTDTCVHDNSTPPVTTRGTQSDAETQRSLPETRTPALRGAAARQDSHPRGSLTHTCADSGSAVQRSTATTRRRRGKLPTVRLQPRPSS